VDRRHAAIDVDNVSVEIRLDWITSGNAPTKPRKPEL
jgi:hypothetical protein